MTRYERLKEKQRAALIAVLTLGLVNVPFFQVWKNSLFEGTSFEKNNKFLLSFTVVTILIAIPSFVFYLIMLIVVTIQLATIPNEKDLYR